MKKLTKWLGWIDNNLLHWSLLFFIVAVSLIPKVPIMHVEYTYIKVRFDDALPILMSLIFFIQWIRRKVKINTAFLIPFIIFWAAVFISFILAYYIQYTVPVFNLGLLHSLRRVQYMVIFFIASSIVYQNKQFHRYMNVYIGTLLVICLYGLGQKVGFLPSIQSMNPAYVDGRLLWLNPEDRINSTFGGHFDLAAYLTLSIPIIIGFYFSQGGKWLVGVFILALTNLLYTAARSSFIAYIISIVGYLVYIKKFKFLFLTLVLTAALLLTTKDMTARFLQTVQIKTVYVNQQTGNEKVEQNINVKQLPAGNYEIKLPFKLIGSNKTPAASQEDVKNEARKNVIENAKKKGQLLTQKEIEEQAEVLAKFIKPQRSVLCDISCATRLQVEWPRAILAFKQYPIFGRGPSSITEATDNDILRWLGELGIVGTGIFMYILLAIARTVFLYARKQKSNEKYIFYGFLAGLLALFINSVYVDVFEASKVAYNFWLLAGIYTGFIRSQHS